MSENAVERQIARIILECKTFEDIRSANLSIQKIFDSESLTLDQMMSIGQDYQNQIGRIALLQEMLPGLEINMYEEE